MTKGSKYLQSELATSNERISCIKGLLVHAGGKDQKAVDRLIERLGYWRLYRAYVTGTMEQRPDAAKMGNVEI